MKKTLLPRNFSWKEKDARPRSRNGNLLEGKSYWRLR